LAYVLVVGSVLTSLLTLLAMAKAWNKAFWQPVEQPLPARRVPGGMAWSAGALVAASLLLTAAAGPVYRYTTDTAHDLAARDRYISAVLPDAELVSASVEPGGQP
jgi:multicomponent Na+:H+ antiporter subunit D